MPTSQLTAIEEASNLSKRLRILAGEHSLAAQDPGKFVAEHFATNRIGKLANVSAEAVKMLISQKQVTEEEAKEAAAVRAKRNK